MKKVLWIYMVRLRGSCCGVGEQWWRPFHVTCDKGEGWTGKSILPLKMMKEEDELDCRDHCWIFFLENLLKWGIFDTLKEKIKWDNLKCSVKTSKGQKRKGRGQEEIQQVEL